MVDPLMETWFKYFPRRRGGKELLSQPVSGWVIRCPDCRGEAVFSEPYSLVEDPASVAREQIGKSPRAVEFDRRGGGGMTVVYHFPDLYPPPIRHNPSPRAGPLRAGVCLCGGCGRRARHTLEWPRDAYFQIEIRGEVLWGYSREHFAGIRDYIACDQRRAWAQKRGYPWGSLMHKLPKVAVAARNREEVIKRMDAVLARTAKVSSKKSGGRATSAQSPFDRSSSQPAPSRDRRRR
jgi:hypothetical protein